MTDLSLPRRWTSLSLSFLLGASLLAGLLFFVSGTWAAPGYQTLEPPRNAVTALPTTTVSITYDEAISAATVTSHTFAVHGMQSGLVTGVHGVVNDGRTIIVTPTRPFHQGELVYAIATTGTLNVTGTEPAVATQWQFNAGKVSTRCVGDFVEDVAASDVITAVDEGSAEWGDYDNDGDLDILLTGWREKFVARVYRNEAGVFTDVGAGLTGVGWSSAAWGDYDNDGDLDILMTGLGIESSSITRLAIVYRNDDGYFAEISAPLTGVNHSDVAWGDYDNDGDLDILLTGSDGTNPVALIYENAETSFEQDVAASTSLVGVWGGSAAWGDYDNDGDLDILLTGFDGSSPVALVYENAGTGFEQDATASAGLAGVRDSSAAWGDYDGDGDLDVLLTGSDGSSPVALVYENTETGFEQDATASANLVGVRYGSAAWGDYDNDGDLDILLTGEDGSTRRVALVYRYENDTGFEQDATASASLAGVRDSSAAWGDYDGDGDLDVLLTGEGDDGRHSAVYRNDDCTDLIITKSVTPALVASGEALTYVLTVSNAGPSAMLDSIIVTDTLPDGMTDVNAAGCDLSALPIVSCTLSEGLGVGQKEEITITGSAPVTPGVITNTAGVATALRDVALSNNSAMVTSTVGQLADLEIVKRGPASVDPSGWLTYTVLITNHGPNTATGVTLADIISDGVFDGFESGYGCAIGTESTVADSISCSPGTIEPDTGYEIWFRARAPSTGGTITNTVTVTDSGTSDTWLSNNRSVLTTYVNFPPTITVPFEEYVTDEDAAAVITFTVGDGDTPLADLDVTGKVSDTGLIENVAFSGMGKDRTATITPVANAYGTTVITFTVSDGALSDSDAFMLTVNPVNDLPTVTVPSAVYTTEEDVPAVITLTAGDVETSVPTVTAAVSDTALVPLSNVAFSQSGVNWTATITPAADAYGSTVITFTVSDGDGGSAEDAFTLEVWAVNDPPVAVDDSETMAEDSGGKGIYVLSNDSPGPNEGELGALELTIEGVGLPGDGTVVSTSRVVTYTPAADFAGMDTFTYTVSDAGGLTDTGMVTVTVTEVNDAPTITVPSEVYTTYEDSAAVITFTVGDVDTPLGSLTVAASASDPNLMASSSSDIDAAGNATATITPRSDAYGTGVIALTVSDGVLTATDAFTLTVLEVNDPPTANDDTETVAEDSGPNGIYVLWNDTTDPDDGGETLTLFGVGAASNGTTAWGSSVVTYTPDADFAGPDAFTYTVADSRGLTATAAVAVTVTEENDPPTITVPLDEYLTDEDAAAVITFTVGDVETALGGLLLAAESSDLTLMASVDFSGSGADRTATIEPLANAYGTAVITFTVKDEEGLVSSDAFTLTVVEVNDPPTASDDTATVAEDSVGNEIWVLLNDSTAPDVGETMSVQAVGLAANGEAGVSASDIVTYTPDADFVGTDTFTYTMNDGRGLTATARVSVTVTAEPEAPTVNVPAETYATDEDVAVSVPFSVQDGDTPLGDLILTAEVSDTALISLGNVVFGRTDPDRTATITPTADAYGSTVITFTVSDGALSDRDAFTLTVAPVNDPPSFDSAPIELAVVDEPYTYTIGAVDPDEGDVLEIRAPEIPSWLTLVDNGDGTATLSGTPTSAQVGDHTVELRVLDDDGLDDTQTFTITVEPTIYRVYLPVVARNYVVAPDLVVESLVATSNGVTVTVRNAGNASIEELFANEFWVDVYVDPDVAPTAVNQTWEVVGDEGLAWGITVDALPLAPGDALTLTLDGPYLCWDESGVSWPLASGASVYAQVDSAHTETAHGTVWEIHELISGAYNNIFGPVIVSSVQGGAAPAREAYRPSPDSHLPLRPRITKVNSLVE